MSERGISRSVFLTRPGDLESIADGYERLYFGHEFCPWLLPGPRRLERVRQAAADRGLSFTLVTPHLGESGLEPVRALVKVLAPREGDELVVNDVGLFELVAAEKWEGTMAAGRLLTRQRRGAGWKGSLPSGAGDARYLRGSSLDSPHFVDLLRDRYGVKRFEIDNLIQGVEVGELPDDVHISVYYPYLFLTATALCPWTFDGSRWRRGERCPACDEEVLELTPEGGGRRILMAGGVQYLENTDANVYTGPAVDRLIHQPVL
jgi:hypothetical protein